MSATLHDRPASGARLRPSDVLAAVRDRVAGLAARRAPRGEEEAPAVLLVSSRHRLWQRYGPDGVFAIERAIGELVEAMAARGLSATLAYADDSPLLSTLGVLPASPESPREVARVVRDLCDRLAWTEERVRYVLLLGDEGVLPFHRVDNPSDDEDETVLTDHLYGCDPDDPLVPLRAVGRIPDPSLELLLGSLRGAAAAHRRIAAGRAPDAGTEAFGYSASIWKRAARESFSALGEPRGLRLSPPLDCKDIPRPGPDGPRLRYYNLHGLADSPNWFGQRDPAFAAGYPEFPVALRPEDVGPAPGAVVFSEACHGARVSGRGPRDAIALAYQAGGALAFAGATGVAYGGLLDGPLYSADLLARRFWEALLAGRSAGEALLGAKVALAAEAMARQGYLDAEDEKAIHNFLLFGDPSLVHHAPARRVVGRARETGGTTGPERTVGRPPARSLAPVAHSVSVGAAHAMPTVPPADLVRYVRKTVARRLPEFSGDDVTVRASSAPRRVPMAAKSVGEPAVLDPAHRPLVITMARSAATCEGQACRTVLQVTVDPKGNIRKLVASR